MEFYECLSCGSPAMNPVCEKCEKIYLATKRWYDEYERYCKVAHQWLVSGPARHIGTNPSYRHVINHFELWMEGKNIKPPEFPFDLSAALGALGCPVVEGKVHNLKAKDPAKISTLDLVNRWIGEHLQKTPKGRTLFRDIYYSFKTWAFERGESPNISKIAFRRALETSDIVIRNGGGNKLTVYNVELKSPRG